MKRNERHFNSKFSVVRHHKFIIIIIISSNWVLVCNIIKFNKLQPTNALYIDIYIYIFRTLLRNRSKLFFSNFRF